YYLTAKAEQVGYHPEVILAGRRINDNMGPYIAQRLVKLLIHANLPVKGARVGILGLTFKENVPDIRNSRVPDIVHEMREFGIEPLAHDPLVNPDEAWEEYQLRLVPRDQLCELDALVLAVGHHQFISIPMESLLAGLRADGVLIDVRSVLDRSQLPSTIQYWSL
ncbi:MAG: nucleotide sugar dehydrogenase, partial [Armatimonadota bacterium]|nr:nucleotide sugar dehydrogenase [Armatimonadota bacterium]